MKGLHKCLAVLSVLGVMSAPSYAGLEPDGTYTACVKYQRSDYAWSNGYKVRGLIVKGDDLNRFASQNGHYSNYSYSSYYFVIPWKEGGYTALDIGYRGSLSSYETTVRDHDEREWSIKDGWNYCY